MRIRLVFPVTGAIAPFEGHAARSANIAIAGRHRDFNAAPRQRAMRRKSIEAADRRVARTMARRLLMLAASGAYAPCARRIFRAAIRGLRTLRDRVRGGLPFASGSENLSA
jgi:hypothetical protein